MGDDIIDMGYLIILGVIPPEVMRPIYSALTIMGVGLEGLESRV